MVSSLLRITPIVLYLVAIPALASNSATPQKLAPTSDWKSSGGHFKAIIPDLPVEHFGEDLATRGDWLFVEAYYALERHASQVVVVYHWQSSRWKRVQILRIRNGTMRKGLVLSQDIAFIPGYLDSKDGNGQNNVIFIFKLKDGRWKDAKALPVQTGGRLVYNGQFLFLNDGRAGIVTIFGRHGAKWVATAKIDTHTTEKSGGANFAVSSDRLVILSYGSGGFLQGMGAISVYKRDAERWTHAATIVPQGKFKDYQFTHCTISPMENRFSSWQGGHSRDQYLPVNQCFNCRVN